MKRFIAAAITLLCVACGGSSDDGAAAVEPAGRARSAANEPPEIVSAAIEPSPAGASDALQLAIVAKDPERDRVRLAVEWYRNGEIVDGLDETGVPAGTFARGDRVYAIVYASDDHGEVSRQTAAVVLGNSAPRVRRVAITPARATALDLLQAEADVVDEDGDPFDLRYRWLRNGQPLPDADGPRLAPGVAHRGETIAVQVMATDGSAESAWVSSPPLGVLNAAPTITTQPNYTLSGVAQYTYDVAAKDPDGDRPLKYELVQGPPGMTVDIVSGRVTWRVPDSAKGAYAIELSVSDPYGGKTTQSYSLAVGWSEAPASAAGANRAVPAPRGAAVPGAAERDDDYTDPDQEEEAADEEF